ncbi:unnamed protein product [Alternaria alternata]
MSSPEAPFNRLPNELKLQVFEELYQDSVIGRRDYINALKVCRQWNVLGTPLLWTYIPINEHNIVPFLRSLEAARKTTGALVRNLSVRLNPPPFDPNAANDLCLIAASKQLSILIASQLRELTSFSFVTPHCPFDPHLQGSTFDASSDDDEEHGLEIPVELCASLIDSLPLSCSTLEFSVDDLEPDDNSAEERIQMPATNPFCEALRRRVPHLEHLRIQADEISPFVFDVLMTGPPLPKLQTLVMSLMSLNIPNQLRMQYTHLGPKSAPVEDTGGLNPQADALASLQWQNVITRQLHTSWQAGRFPSATSPRYRNAAGIHVCTNRLWKTSTTGIRVVKETKEMSKYDLKWMEPMQQGIPLDNFCERIKAENGAGGLMVGNYLGSTMSTLRGGWIKSGVVEWYNTISDATLERLRQTEEQA